MTPKLGQKVYCVYNDDCILVETVGFIGKYSFIIENFADDVNFDSLEWFYEDYNDLWFTDLSKAKKRLREIYYERYKTKAKKITNRGDWYEVEE
jgi:hypothetical protein